MQLSSSSACVTRTKGSISKEGGDRKTLRLHADEEQMLQEFGGINENTIVVLIGGNVIMLDPWIEKIPALLMTFYPGVRGAAATANLIFGNANPSGKLPFAIAKKESDYPVVNWDAAEQHYSRQGSR